METVLVNLVLENLNKDIDFDDQLQSEIFFQIGLCQCEFFTPGISLGAQLFNFY